MIVRLENRGGAAWTDGFRLGAATGCPDAAAANEIAWEPAAGYANGLGDARVSLPQPVAPDGVVEIRVSVRAPSEPGTYTFAARMVHEGVAWFGATATIPVEVVGGTTSDDARGSASGCATTSSAGHLLVLLIAGGTIRRSGRARSCRRRGRRA